jgi:hypothetical protein
MAEDGEDGGERESGRRERTQDGGDGEERETVRRWTVDGGRMADRPLAYWLEGTNGFSPTARAKFC